MSEQADRDKAADARHQVRMMDRLTPEESQKRAFAEKVERVKAMPGPVDYGPIPEFDPVKKPVGYTSHPSGVECITVVEQMSFLRGTATRYLWRAGTKNPSVEGTIQDLEKAIQYIRREINQLKGTASWD